jgi:hypothetical protein
MSSCKTFLWMVLGFSLLSSFAMRDSFAEPADGVAAPGRAASAVELPIYVPPDIGLAGEVSGAAARGAGGPSLRLLAPDHLALTTREQPTLYWYLSEATSLPIEVTLSDRESVKPLLEVRLPSPAQAGVHALRLAEHGVRLLPDTRYKWFVSIVPDAERRSRDSTAGAGILRRDPSTNLRERLELASPEGRDVFVYAENGIWYDAIAAVSSRIEAAPASTELRAQRAALLEQVGLAEVAEFDRRRNEAP